MSEYYDDPEFAELRVIRTDAAVNFSWDVGSPDLNIGADTVSVRWTGQIIPRYSETYTFHTISDDGVRVRLDGVTLIDNWTDHPPTEATGTVALIAGEAYDPTSNITRMESVPRFSFCGRASARPREVIPPSQLYTSRPAIASGLVTFEAVGPLGTVVSRQELVGPVAGVQRVTLRGFRDRIHFVRVISPNALCLPVGRR